MTSPPVITGQKVDPQWNGAVLNLEQKIVPASDGDDAGVWDDGRDHEAD